MTTLPERPAITSRLARTLASAAAAALILLIPRAHHALPPNPHRPDHSWHTQGSHILDPNNHEVRIAGLNWSGFETTEAVPGGLRTQDYRTLLRTVKAHGYNTVRIPLSNQMVETPGIPGHVSFSNPMGPINRDLRGLNSLEILDRIVAYADEIGLKILLDNHRSEAGSSAEESGLWYTPQYPESAWIRDWTRLAARYRDTPAVIGMDLRNEPHNADKGGACWDCGGPHDWHLAAERAGNAILAVNPRLLILVEGVDSYAGDTYWWGGNLEGVRRSPVHLAVPNHLVYSAHEYGPAEYPQPWFNNSTTHSTLAGVWRQHWAFISEAGLAPVWIGEFGTPNDDVDVESSAPGSEGQWFASLVSFFRGHTEIGWTYWGLNGEDRYGLLDQDYSGEAANSAKQQALASISQRPGAFPKTPPTLVKFRTESLVTAFTRSPDPETTLRPLIPQPDVAQPAQPFAASRRRAPVVKSANSREHGIPGPADLDIDMQNAIAESIREAVRKANRSLAQQPGAPGQ